MATRAESLYVHIPYCERKCHYCAFNSAAGASDDEKERYVDAVLRELELLVSKTSPLPLRTIYVGGGTPTSLEAPALERLLRTIRASTQPETLEEWTVEANPGTLTPDRLEALVRAGVTRISMGVQTLDPERLRKLGRIHTPEDVAHSVEALRRAGVGHYNLDLIYAQPNQSLEDWRRDVEGILELEPSHLSLYALQYEEDTPFGRAHVRGQLVELPEEEQLAMFRLARGLLRVHGFELYEISNFARAGCESRHNINYWRNRPYFGIGAGAYGYVGGERLKNELNAHRYIERIFETGSAVVERDLLGPREEYIETLAAGLRTREGVDLEALEVRTGFDLKRRHSAHFERLLQEGIAELLDRRLVLTEAGLWVLDSVLEGFLDDGGDSAVELSLTERSSVVT